MDNEKKYYVYAHINKVNGKAYIGITSKEPASRWANGNGYKGQKFYYAIKKYGWDNFEHIILEKDISKEEISEKEHYYIKKYNSYNNGYNLTYGGFGLTESPIFAPYIYPEYSDNKKLKPIICVNDKKIYENYYEVGKQYGINPRTVKDRCLKQKPSYQIDPITKRNYIFLYYDENENDEYYDLKNTIIRIIDNSIICLETQEVFCSGAEAGRITGICDRYILNNCCNKFNSAKNYHFKYYKEYLNMNSADIEEALKKGGVAKKIVLVNTGEIFESITEATKKYPVTIDTIIHNIKGVYSYAGIYNYTPLIWQDYDSYLIKPRNLESSMCNKMVHCITTDEYFLSMHAATKKYHFDYKDLSKCCLGKKEYAGKDKNGRKLQWEYYYPYISQKINVIE